MAGYVKWADIRAKHVARAGGEKAVAEGVAQLKAEIRAYRLAETRRRMALTQSEVAERMGVSKGRVSQIENGEVSTIDALSRYVSALGGELRLVADFDEETILVGTDEFLRRSQAGPAAA
ncbi:helix-turn-helix protein [Stackebrandtia endophytica]|uniref:Helix-turn-helix protein n=1 Tax=Stackebrandtia endophytica TaxID=1496996 RepID=A0A543AUX2_9ACTN|nr:helix-turn-helix domain-containing protein [Stackebrandtia endophytica]TQL76365.1 helix-turn-helix protein [Stackebrandtia endophytica]